LHVIKSDVVIKIGLTDYYPRESFLQTQTSRYSPRVLGMSHLEFSVAIRTIGLSTAIWMRKNCRKKWSWQKAVEEAV
jgi:hypothetical protein